MLRNVKFEDVRIGQTFLISSSKYTKVIYNDRELAFSKDFHCYDFGGKEICEVESKSYFRVPDDKKWIYVKSCDGKISSNRHDLYVSNTEPHTVLVLYGCSNSHNDFSSHQEELLSSELTSYNFTDWAKKTAFEFIINGGLRGKTKSV